MLDLRRLAVSSGRIAGQTLGEIDLQGRFGATTTAQSRRADVDLLGAADDLVLELGDRLRLIAPPTSSSPRLAAFLGDSETRLAEVDSRSAAFGVALGIRARCRHVPGPPPTRRRLRRAHRRTRARCPRAGSGPVQFAMGHQAALTPRQLGTVVFLAAGSRTRAGPVQRGGVHRRERAADRASSGSRSPPCRDGVRTRRRPPPVRPARCGARRGSGRCADPTGRARLRRRTDEPRRTGRDRLRGRRSLGDDPQDPCRGSSPRPRPSRVRGCRRGRPPGRRHLRAVPLVLRARCPATVDPQGVEVGAVRGVVMSMADDARRGRDPRRRRDRPRDRVVPQRSVGGLQDRRGRRPGAEEPVPAARGGARRVRLHGVGDGGAGGRRRARRGRARSPRPTRASSGR